MKCIGMNMFGPEVLYTLISPAIDCVAEMAPSVYMDVPGAHQIGVGKFLFNVYNCWKWLMDNMGHKVTLNPRTFPYEARQATQAFSSLGTSFLF